MTHAARDTPVLWLKQRPKNRPFDHPVWTTALLLGYTTVERRSEPALGEVCRCMNCKSEGVYQMDPFRMPGSVVWPNAYGGTYCRECWLPESYPK